MICNAKLSLTYLVKSFYLDSFILLSNHHQTAFVFQPTLFLCEDVQLFQLNGLCLQHPCSTADLNLALVPAESAHLYFSKINFSIFLGKQTLVKG